MRGSSGLLIDAWAASAAGGVGGAATVVLCSATAVPAQGVALQIEWHHNIPPPSSQGDKPHSLGLWPAPGVGRICSFSCNANRKKCGAHGDS